MAKTDQPFKRLITLVAREFISWALNTEVRSAKLVSSEHTAIPDPIHSDLIFDITLADGRKGLMPIEFQGRSSSRPMPFRVLEYMTRTTINEEPAILHCLVVYVGKGSYPNDTGTHQIDGLKDYPTLLWHYQVIHLWDMDAHELLNLDRPVLLPLVGQMRMDDPERIIAEVVARLKTVPDPALRGQLFMELLALMPDEEATKMTEKLMEKEDIVFDSPYLRRIREEADKEGFSRGIEQGIERGIERGREEGIEQGIERGREEGIEQGIERGIERGIEKGREEGHIHTLRETILDALGLRLDPTLSTYRSVEKMLETISDEQTLRSLFRQVLEVKSGAAFQQAVEQAVSSAPRNGEDRV